MKQIEFKLNQKEIRRLQKFRKKYPLDYTGAVGGGETISFTQTGIGTIVEVSRYSNGSVVKKDLTDYDIW